MTKSSRPLRSWRWLLPIASLPLLACLLTALVGGADHLEILTGTRPLAAAEMLLGALYLLSYLAVTVVSPVLVLAAALIAIRDRLVRR